MPGGSVGWGGGRGTEDVILGRRDPALFGISCFERTLGLEALSDDTAQVALQAGIALFGASFETPSRKGKQKAVPAQTAIEMITILPWVHQHVRNISQMQRKQNPVRNVHNQCQPTARTY